ncbi:Trypsin-1, partial [Cyphomyrmex costatus]
VITAVNTEKHEYVDIMWYPYHYLPCIPTTNKTICHSHVALIGSQYSTVTIEFVIPIQVSIQIAGRHVCSGAFIHESWIMTAASCVFSAKSSTVSVHVRSSSTSTDGDVLEIDNIVVHEYFDKYVYYNDIALMKLKSPAEFGEKLLPIGLPENEELQDGAHCVVTGWKRTVPNFQGTSPSGAQLEAAAVTIVNQRTCEAMMPSYKPLSKDMLCATNATRRSERCQADVGAPLVSEQMLIGILSYGLGCETGIHPDVYTRVSSYLSWIFTNTGMSYE